MVTKSTFPDFPNTSQWTLYACYNSTIDKIAQAHTCSSGTFTVNSSCCVLVACRWLRSAFTEGTAIWHISLVIRRFDALAAHAMWTTKGSFIILAVVLCSAAGRVTGAEATNPGLQSAFTSKGLAYSELGGALGSQAYPARQCQLLFQYCTLPYVQYTPHNLTISLSLQPLFVYDHLLPNKKVAEIGRPILDQQLRKIKIPDISGGGCSAYRLAVGTTCCVQCIG